MTTLYNGSMAARTHSARTARPSTRTSRPAHSRKQTGAQKQTDTRKQTDTDVAGAETLTTQAPAPVIPADQPGQFGRVVILNVTPEEEGNKYPARVELGEVFEVSAQVFMEGRTRVGATAVLRNPRGRIMQRVGMTCVNPGLDRWTGMLRVGDHSNAKPWQPQYTAVKRLLGDWTVTVEGWEDVFASWLHDAIIKIGVHDDVENALTEGAQLVSRWAGSRESLVTAHERALLNHAVKVLADRSATPERRLAAVHNTSILAIHRAHPLRDALSSTQPRHVLVQRPASSFAAWYQFFPRSEGAYYDQDSGRVVPGTLIQGTLIQGTLRSAVSGLERAAAEGFDVVYLPPVFPIGTTNRKGRDNSLVANPGDPGSPFAIGSSLGGHDTVDPTLGTMDDFKALCSRAHELGLEVALDFALQCSPDHPWVKEHPSWFRHKADGSVAFAENPPKKYQDIYPIDFNADMPGIEHEVERILELWIDAGVSIFRVDNPHTKPVRFWQDVIGHVTKRHHEVLFLAEAFTRPGMMRALSYAGFTQSHCYFPWRNTKEELEEYLGTTNGDNAYYQHNTFWPTTPDILTAYIRDNGIAGHAVRAVLAAMGSPSWGIYNGYELIENSQRAGSEEQSSNEKYQITVRNWGDSERIGIAKLLTTLNAIRRRHPACQSYHDLQILRSGNPSILAFSRHVEASLCADDHADSIIVVVNLDARNAQQGLVHIEPENFGLSSNDTLHVHDELTGREFDWSRDNFVSLAPWQDVAHILSIRQ